jgi:hypothetical protein
LSWRVDKFSPSKSEIFVHSSEAKACRSAVQCGKSSQLDVNLLALASASDFWVLGEAEFSTFFSLSTFALDFH